ncbi:hypothetical protein DM01DRAFT_1142106 [Hesseltinella vesiculosa]|uniref:CENP-V/GFA domain-containing protein n=1 Tax=Hesseltinella vesiculosa TaxID=101127 RepID=A0A1X2G7M9_9FUNG|nr:hypothetical protein DM01DRAFT_1142106 [Hesseltinella vesiculosa]
MSDQEIESLQGGCLCGQFRFTVDLDAKLKQEAQFCHCTMCRKMTNSQFWTCLSVPRQAFHVHDGCPPLKLYKSSDKAHRGFCTNCGSSLTWEPTDYPEYLDIGIGSLDHPEKVNVTSHLHVEGGMLPYDPTLPRFLRGPSGPQAP